MLTPEETTIVRDAMIVIAQERVRISERVNAHMTGMIRLREIDRELDTVYSQLGTLIGRDPHAAHPEAT
jgi:hypothetical protein